MSASGTAEAAETRKHTSTPAARPSAIQAQGSPVAGAGLHFLTGFSYSTKRPSVEVDPTVRLAPTKQNKTENPTQAAWPETDQSRSEQTHS